MGVDCVVDFFVMQAEERAYPIILGRPWLMAIHAKQDWESGLMSIYDKNNACTIVYNMKTRGFYTLHDEEEKSSSSSDGYSSDDSNEESTTTSASEEEDILQISPDLFCVSIESIKEKHDEEKSKEVDVRSMLGEDLTEREKQEYISMCEEFPNTFCN